MARRNHKTNYLRKYPQLKERPDILDLLIVTDRKMRYMEIELKQEKFESDQKKRVARFVPSREDSFDRLQEEKWQFKFDERESDEKINREEEYARLYKAMHLLKDHEAELIKALYFERKSEEEYSKQIGSSQRTVNRRKYKILNKLKTILEKI